MYANVCELHWIVQPFYWFIAVEISRENRVHQVLEDRNSLGVASHMRRICDQVLSLAAAFECGLASYLHRWASTVQTSHTAASSRCCGHAGHLDKKEDPCLALVFFFKRWPVFFSSLCFEYFREWLVVIVHTTDNGVQRSIMKSSWG